MISIIRIGLFGAYIELSFQLKSYYFLFLHKNICCVCSLEVPQQAAANEYPQHVFVEK